MRKTILSTRSLVCAIGMASLMAVPLAAQTSAFQQEFQNQPDTSADEEAPSPQSEMPLAAGYILGPGDVVEVSVAGQEEYRSRVQVQVDGSIQLPFIRDVQAEDRTVAQLQDEVADRLRSGGYYTDPVVNVIVAGYASRYVTVLGQVGSQGLVPIDRNYRLSEMIARVGGIGPNGSETVTLIRASGEKINVTLEEMATGGPAMDPYVAAGDKIFVDRVEAGSQATFCIYGAVNAAGCYPVGQTMTLRMALARAGGLNNLGSEKKIDVFRNGREIGRIDLSQPVLEGDVLKVGERFF
ncbi:capsular biosynthesis protein [Erythrobacter litoralis]|uniref:polysaccharide biosynthesis/export family protein n=1 Tax=Erythrobacter litoralis TaxID=39960 RepID=UPI0024352EFA|nr:polysaccharide export protein [Erythrobacter litoralis]MDG6079108.1 capsular biosynthesis protein [Erythrobacter litoralis]